MFLGCVDVVNTAASCAQPGEIEMSVIILWSSQTACKTIDVHRFLFT